GLGRGGDRRNDSIISVDLYSSRLSRTRRSYPARPRWCGRALTRARTEGSQTATRRRTGLGRKGPATRRPAPAAEVGKVASGVGWSRASTIRARALLGVISKVTFARLIASAAGTSVSAAPATGR